MGKKRERWRKKSQDNKKHVGVPTNVIEQIEKKLVKFDNMKGECGACIHKRRLSKRRKPINGVQREGTYKGMGIWPVEQEVPCASYFFCMAYWSTHGKQGCPQYTPRKVGLRKPPTEAEMEMLKQKKAEERNAIRQMMRSNPYATR